MRSMKNHRKLAAEQQRARDAEAAADASAREERRRLWEIAPQLFTGSDDATGKLVETPSKFVQRRSSISRREIPPAAQKMQMLAEADAVARVIEENATALAITMSLAEGGDSANGTALGS